MQQTGMTFLNMAWYFIIYAFLGWCLEVVFCSANTGKFVNRGFLNGPVCPIYGFGVCIVVAVLSPISHNLLLLFVGSVILTSLLELVTGWVLARAFHTKWWDYSDQPFNLGGYVCLKFSLAWGVACVLVMRVVHPAIEGLVSIVPQLASIILLSVFYLVLGLDVVVTVVAIRKLNRDLGELTRLAQGLHSSSEAMAQKLGNAAISVSKKVEDLHLDERKQELDEKWEAGKARANAAVQDVRDWWAGGEREENKELQSKLLDMTSGHTRVRSRLLRAFPNMSNTRYGNALANLKTWISQHTNLPFIQEEDAYTADQDKPQTEENNTES